MGNWRILWHSYVWEQVIKSVTQIKQMKYIQKIKTIYIANKHPKKFIIFCTFLFFSSLGAFILGRGITLGFSAFWKILQVAVFGLVVFTKI